MEYIGTGSGKKRIELLKDAAKQLVDTIAGQAAHDEADQQAGAVRAGAVLGLGQCRAGQGNRSLDGPGRHLADPSREFRLVDLHRSATRKWSRTSAASTTRRAPAGARKRTRRSRASRSTIMQRHHRRVHDNLYERQAELHDDPLWPNQLCELGGLRRGAALPLQQQRRHAGDDHAGHAVRADVRARTNRRQLDITRDQRQLLAHQQLVERPDRGNAS